MRLHLAIHIDDGSEALSTFGDAPFDLRIGDGTLAPGLEALLIGLPAGADERVLADGSAVFGAPDPALIQTIEQADLPAGFSAEPGQIIAFTTPAGHETAGTVLAVGDGGVEVDFNPPLARRGLSIRIQVLAVEP